MRNKPRVGFICLFVSLLLSLTVRETSFASELESSAESLHRAATWSAKSGTSGWTEKALATIRSRIGALERARDKNEFCPGYADASKRNQEVCWLRLISAVTLFESNYKEDAMFREANGNYSVGLLMLSTNECDEAPTKSELKNPQRNLECGIEKMAYLIGQDGFIDGPKSSRGAAAYWSTLRDPYNSGNMHLGKRNKIEALTKSYKSF